MCVIERHLTFIYPLPCYVTGLALRGSYLWALHHRYGHSAPRRRNGRVADMQLQQRAETARSSGSGGRDRVRGSVGEYVQLLSCGRASMAAVGCGRSFLEHPGTYYVRIRGGPKTDREGMVVGW